MSTRGFIAFPGYSKEDRERLMADPRRLSIFFKPDPIDLDAEVNEREIVSDYPLAVALYFSGYFASHNLTGGYTLPHHLILKGPPYMFDAFQETFTYLFNVYSQGDSTLPKVDHEICSAHGLLAASRQLDIPLLEAEVHRASTEIQRRLPYVEDVQKMLQRSPPGCLARQDVVSIVCFHIVQGTLPYQAKPLEELLKDDDFAARVKACLANNEELWKRVKPDLTEQQQEDLRVRGWIERETPGEEMECQPSSSKAPTSAA